MSAGRVGTGRVHPEKRLTSVGLFDKVSLNVDVRVPSPRFVNYNKKTFLQRRSSRITSLLAISRPV